MSPHTFCASPHRSAACRAALLLAILAVLTAPLMAQNPVSGSTPEVAVVFNLRSSDLTVVDHKYRVFFNKFEKKTLPIEGYDLSGAIRDEVMTTLAQDQRFHWRQATEADKLDAAKLADEKNRTPDMVSSAQADRVLVVDVAGFGAWISGLAKDRMEIMATVTMLDRASGRKLWKHRIWEKIPFSGDLQKLQADNQKEMKEGINSLIEKASQKLIAKVAESKV
jgi:hypothetical protein